MFSVVGCSFSKNCLCVEAAPREWKAVHVNRKRFGAESSLITGSRNKKAQPLRGVGVSCGGDCVASRLDPTARVVHRRHDFLRAGKNSRKSTQYRFIVSHQQGTRRGRSGLAVSSKCVVGGTLRDWPDRKATRGEGSSSPDYEWRLRAPEWLQLV